MIEIYRENVKKVMTIEPVLPRWEGVIGGRD